MRKFKIKPKLFKNDPFGIKGTYFMWRIKRHIRKNTEVRTKAIKVYVNIINEIGIPTNDESKELLRKVIKSYDETIDFLEESVKYARIYIQEGENVK